jgi:hypothetical protein
MSLSTEDQEFFETVARAAFCNPFTDEYQGLIDDISHFTGRDGVGPMVATRVESAARQGLGELSDFPGKQREIMRLVFLYDAYYQVQKRLDELVIEQLAAGDEPVKVPFARDTVSLLRKRGFPTEEALRYFAIFFQIRRAAHFIDRGLIGPGASMKTLRRRLWENVFTHDIRCYEQSLWNRMEDFSTLLLGETGTGKGTAAAAIGRSAFIPFNERAGAFAESFTRVFISLNLSQFPATLIESELFGHKKGAFTGAMESHQGVLERCSPFGAIFLDEIGDVSVPVQIKLLQVLQDRTFRPVGSHDRRHFRGRIIAATNQSLAELRDSGLFRADFYYRLCSDAITVPPLRQRFAEEPRELDDLLKHLLKRLAGETFAAQAPRFRSVLTSCVGRDYPWPGNVRELEQALRRIVLTERYDPDPFSMPKGDPAGDLAAALDAGSIDAETLVGRYCTMLHRRYGTIEEVARRTNLDRRTVKKYLAK